MLRFIFRRAAARGGHALRHQHHHLPAVLRRADQPGAGDVRQELQRRSRSPHTEHRLGLDQPLVKQYATFVKGIFVGRTIGEGDFVRECPAPCLGYSFRTDEPVTGIDQAHPPGHGEHRGRRGGAVAGARRHARHDLGAVTGNRVRPGRDRRLADRRLHAGLLLRPDPVAGAGLQHRAAALADVHAADRRTRFQWASGLLLPWMTLGFLNSALYARLSRAQMLETLSEDFVRTARAKGLPKRTRLHPARAARRDHPDRHHRRPGHRRQPRRCGHHRDDLRPAGHRPAGCAVASTT